jgi:hypothetical protein
MSFSKLLDIIINFLFIVISRPMHVLLFLFLSVIMHVKLLVHALINEMSYGAHKLYY